MKVSNEFTNFFALHLKSLMCQDFRSTLKKHQLHLAVCRGARLADRDRKAAA
jgi:hypothetical protein